MKKLFSLVLVMVLATGVAVAAGPVIKISEDQDAFDLYLTLPDDAMIVGTEVQGEYAISNVTIGSDENLVVKIVTSPDEMYSGISLADLSDEEIAMIVSWYTEEMVQPNVEHFTSANGFNYIVINENYADGSSDSCEAISLNLGYQIMVSVTHADFSVLTDAETAVAAAIMESLQVVNQ